MSLPADNTNQETTLQQLQQELVRALGQDDEEAIVAAVRSIATEAHTDFPTFHKILNALGYYNRLQLLNELMYAAWGEVQETAAYSKPAVTAYATRAADHLIYQHVTLAMAEDGGANGSATEPDPDDPVLRERLEHYFPVDTERLAPYMKLLTGTVGRRWTMQDFAELEMPALSGLMIEFLGYAHRHEQVPFSRAHLLREHLPRYLLDRQAGNLAPRMDMAAALRGRRPFPKPDAKPAHPLCPDRTTLNLFLERMLQTLEPLPYAAGALLQLQAPWLHFLRFRQLIDAPQHEHSLADLRGLGQELASYWSDHEDEHLRQTVSQWP
jgi:hypothetical protein